MAKVTSPSPSALSPSPALGWSYFLLLLFGQWYALITTHPAAFPVAYIATDIRLRIKAETAIVTAVMAAVTFAAALPALDP